MEFGKLKQEHEIHLFHEEKDFIPSTPYVILDFLHLHLNKILNSIWPFYNAEIAAENKLCQ